jgi:hypothetical protein
MQRYSKAVLMEDRITRYRQDNLQDDASEQIQRLARPKQVTYPFLQSGDAKSNLQSVKTNDSVGIPDYPDCDILVNRHLAIEVECCRSRALSQSKKVPMSPSSSYIATVIALEKSEQTSQLALSLVMSRPLYVED